MIKLHLFAKLSFPKLKGLQEETARRSCISKFKCHVLVNAYRYPYSYLVPTRETHSPYTINGLIAFVTVVLASIRSYGAHQITKCA